MRLYFVQELDGNQDTYFYWAKDEGDALDLHEEQGHDMSRDWVAQPVWTDNKEPACRGYVVQE